MRISDEEYVRSLNIIAYKGLNGVYNSFRFIYGDIDRVTAEKLLNEYKKDNPDAYSEIFNKDQSESWIQYAVFDSGWFELGQLGPGITIEQHRLDADA